ncbi:hypothetical protein ACHAXM_007684 [Skeletonema potamos]
MNYYERKFRNKVLGHNDARKVMDKRRCRWHRNLPFFRIHTTNTKKFCM